MLAPQVSPLNPPTLFPNIEGTIKETNKPKKLRVKFFINSINESVYSR